MDATLQQQQQQQNSADGDRRRVSLSSGHTQSSMALAANIATAQSSGKFANLESAKRDPTNSNAAERRASLVEQSQKTGVLGNLWNRSASHGLRRAMKRC